MLPRNRKPAFLRALLLVVMCAYLLGSAWRQSNQRSEKTIIGDLVWALRGGSVRSTQFGSFSQYLVPSDTGWRVVDPDDYSQEDFGNPEVGLVVVDFDLRSTRKGAWHVLSSDRVEEISFLLTATSASIDDPSIRAALLQAVENATPGTVPPSKIANWVSGGTSTRQVLWLGVLGDLSVLAALLIAVVSLRALMRLIVMPPDGRCMHCGYDVSGLTAMTCPECGNVRRDTPSVPASSAPPR